jgi:peptide/nickel transport system substrate-binding protein
MKKLVGFFIVAMMVFPSLALASSSDTLIWGRGGDSVTLDLAQATDGESIKAGIQVLQNLVKFGDNSMNVEPQLATSWKVSKDGKNWTFKLRKGVKFQDGTDFNAKAVYDSLDRIIDKNHPFHKYGQWKYLSLSLKYVTKITVIDNYTIRLTTLIPYAPLINNLALWLCPILSPKAMAKYKNQIGMHPVGTGPYKFVDWVKDDHITLVRNDHYWGSRPKLKKIVLKSIPETSTRLMALQSGAIDIADDLDPDSIALVRKAPNLRVKEAPSVNIGYLAINTTRPYFADVRVRRAINYAIDKDTLIKTLYGGLAIPAKSAFPPSIWSYNNAIVPYAYNPKKARALLKAADYDFNRVIELWAMPVSRAYMPQPIRTAELIQANLAAVGMKTKIVRYDWGTYLKETSNGKDDMCMLGWLGGNADPDNFLYGLLSADSAKVPGAANVALWSNAEFTALVKKAQRTFSKRKRTRYYKKAQMIFHDQAPWVPLVHTKVVRCYSKRVHDVPLRPNGLNSFEMVWKK